MNGALQWGGAVGTSQLCSTFDYNWGTGPVFSTYNTYIGFIATMQVNMQRIGPVSFTVGSDDGIRLSVDGSVVIDDFTAHSYRTQSLIMNLGQGMHPLTLQYYQETVNAQASFTCDSDILQWNS